MIVATKLRLELIMLNHKKYGFTLAEVLITLGVIGVVAAMTVPNMVTKYKNNVVLTTLKKQYADMFDIIKTKLTEFST